MPHAMKTEHRYVHKDLAVCGDDPVIVSTRIPVRLIYQPTQMGDYHASLSEPHARADPRCDELCL